MSVSTITARCARCKRVKPASAFHKGSRASGLHSYCKKCARESASKSAHRARAANEAANKSAAYMGGGRCAGFINLGSGRWANTVQCSRSAAPGTGGFCLTHVPRPKRGAARKLARILRGDEPFASDAHRQRRAEEERAELIALLASDPELARLVAEQERDSHSFLAGARGLVSLDDDSKVEGGYHEYLGYGHFWLSSYVPDAWTDVVIALVDRRREIDEWADAA